MRKSLESFCKNLEDFLENRTEIVVFSLVI
ncbi:hypothetical protein PRJBM_00191 [Bartonella henselae]|nr:hypothetical protein Q653_01196 [Bartonella henselae JK 42]ETS10256.1 hypothetical protein Q654_00538 [Bartonella henselae JK 50]ETS10763.1 hypothetical protein Q655_00486 [Bartonella henselae JK 51]ETS16346.1 hypothetical protein Q652_00030 [Bartonella henselae JK 41]KEC57794.1 hypothetical protein O97_00829 [Bartonella henselae str. Zeus]KEC62884.1 hypothetical protein O95_00493 [Bartonella henselae JK 53]CDO39586.1 hypothetical protein PRJBM_00191 [Bartonella henselae]